MTKVTIAKGEPLEKALRVFKKKLSREGTLRKLRTREHYEKPSERRKRKRQTARSRR